MRQSYKCSKIGKFLSLLINGFPLVRGFRVCKKIRHKRLKMHKRIDLNLHKNLKNI